MNHFYQKIEGWFDFPNLYSFVVSKSNDNSKFVEIGSWLGKSAAYMAVEICNSEKNISFYCVDTWKGSEEHSSDDLIIQDKLYESFLTNVSLAKDYITPVRLSSKEASQKFEDESLDFIFIDAGHSYEDVYEDLRCWFPKLKNGGFFAGHDYSAAWPGVIKAVQEWAIENKFIISLVEQSCWLMKKPIQDSHAVVVSSHYKEDLNWVNLVNYPVKIYSKTVKNQNFIDFNKVQEVPAYLKYIIENYNNLPEYSIFIHGHLMSEHQEDNIVNIINNVKLDQPIINLNRKDWKQTISKGDEFQDRKFSWIEDNWKDIIGDYLQLPDSLSFPSCAQFAVHKSCIQQYPIEFWKHLFDWCQKTKLENFISSRIFEYIWYYIFSGKRNFFE
jgi:predicted O-methyltransferase YrrM